MDFNIKKTSVIFEINALRDEGLYQTMNFGIRSTFFKAFGSPFLENPVPGPGPGPLYKVCPAQHSVNTECHNGTIQQHLLQHTIRH